MSNASANYPRTKKVLPGPVGGPCLSKDTYLLLSSKKIQKYRKKSLIFKARKINEGLGECFKKCLVLNKQIFEKKKKLNILIVGMSFKGYPITDDIRGSISLEIIKVVNRFFKSKEILGYDPYVNDEIYLKNPIKKINTNIMKNYKFDLVINCSNNEYFLKVFKKGNIVMRKSSLIFDYWSRINNFSKLIDNKLKCYLINYGSEYSIKKI